MIEAILFSVAALGLALLLLLGAGAFLLAAAPLMEERSTRTLGVPTLVDAGRPATASPGALPRHARSLWGLPQTITSARAAILGARRDATS
jgi:hypothetical protein